MEWKEPRPRPEPHPGTKRTQSSTVLLLLLLLAAFARLSAAGPPKLARPPLLSGQPFIIFWGVPDSSCSDRLDPRTFGMERGSRVAVFYEDTLGNYPYFVDKDTPVNGGLPQHTRLNNHLQKIQQDLDAALPTPRFLGLGVLRWSEWVPQWSRNRERQEMYREASRNLMKTFFPGWTPEEVEKWSQMDFEAAAQSVITETLREVRWLRPKALWGISPYPSCYNGDATQTSLANYTGMCPASEMALNDELLWLWKRSSAVYPLLSMEKMQVSVLSLITGEQRPMKNPQTSISPEERNTLGESAAMGTAGVVIWEKSEPKSQCQDLTEFVTKVLGPYSLNVTTATRLCSASLCQGRGRCVRQNAERSAYLHLPPPPTSPEKVRMRHAGCSILDPLMSSGRTTVRAQIDVGIEMDSWILY
uniref:Hyaluronidase n=1 Tax=Gouania willdenowi TaxID=441366 RepID=A0A8C5EDS2_GOUWI